MSLNELETFFITELRSGNYHPQQYAKLIDIYYEVVLKQPIIYGEHLTKDYKIGVIKDIENVNKRRKSIYLESLEDSCKKGNLECPKY